MKLYKGQKIVALFSIVILLAAATVAILSGLVEGFKFWMPILNFFLFVLLGFSVLCYALAFIKKSTPNFFIGCVLLLPCMIYSFIMFALPWWVIIIALFAVIAVSILLSLLVAGNMTEGVVTDRKTEDKK